MHRQLGAGEDDTDGVDEERHVVGDDHDDRVRRFEAVTRLIRVEDSHQRLARSPAP